MSLSFSLISHFKKTPGTKWNRLSEVQALAGKSRKCKVIGGKKKKSIQEANMMTLLIIHTLQRATNKLTLQESHQKLGCQSLYFPLWGDFLSAIKQFNTADHLPLLITCKIITSRHKLACGLNYGSWIFLFFWWGCVWISQFSPWRLLFCLNQTEEEGGMVLNVRPSHWLPAMNTQALACPMERLHPQA